MTAFQRLLGFCRSHKGLMVAAFLALSLAAGLILWQDSSHAPVCSPSFVKQSCHKGTGGVNGFIAVFVLGPLLVGFVLLVVGLVVVMVGYAVALLWGAFFLLRGVFIILFGDLCRWVSLRRNGHAAKAGDAKAQEKIERWKKWEKEWTRSGPPWPD